MLIGSTIFGDLLVFIITIVWAATFYILWSYRYWDRKGVPYLKPIFPYGNIKRAHAKETEFTLVYRCYEELRARGLKHGGIYSMTTPVYMPVDVEYIKNIMITDFNYFYDRSNYSNEKYDPVSTHLLNLDGQRWKNMRIKLTPVFTSGKMKTMFHTMLTCGNQMIEAVENLNGKDPALDIKEIIARYTTDIIGSCAFGIDCNSFTQPDPEFRRIGRRALHISKVRRFQRLLTNSFPNLARFLGIPGLPRETSEFFMNMTQSAVEYRKKNNYKRNDVLQILMDLHKEFENNEKVLGLNKTEVENVRSPLTIGEIAANSFLFFVAGFETSSTTLSFLCYELSQNQDVQESIRREINTALEKHGGQITYELLAEMKYMRQAFDEILRMYPIVPVFKRKCTEDYEIPGTDVVLDKGTKVYVSVIGVQRNPDYFPKPDKFDPDRFSDENKDNIRSGSYLGFGEGPRFCIGKRFGLMQMTIAMILLLKSYKITLNPKTKVPIEIDTNSILQTTKGEIWINLEKI